MSHAIIDASYLTVRTAQHLGLVPEAARSWPPAVLGQALARYCRERSVQTAKVAFGDTGRKATAYPAHVFRDWAKAWRIESA